MLSYRALQYGLESNKNEYAPYNVLPCLVVVFYQLLLETSLSMVAHIEQFPTIDLIASVVASGARQQELSRIQADHK